MTRDEVLRAQPQARNAETRILRWLTRWLPVLLALFVATVIVGQWRPSSSVIASGDVLPFTEFNPGKWLFTTFALWTTDWAPVGDIHYGSGYLLASAIEYLPRHFGVSTPILQRIEFILIISGVFLSSFALPKAIGISSRAIPRVIGSAAYTLSVAFLFNITDPINDLHFLVIALMPLLYIKVLEADREHFVPLVGIFGLVSQIFAYLFNNPAHAVSSAISVVLLSAFVALRCNEKRICASRSCILVFSTVCLNLWWLVPAYLTSFGSSLQITAVTDVSSWSWTQSHSSLLNVFRLRESWAWPIPVATPWASYYEPVPLQIAMMWPLLCIAWAVIISSRSTRGRRHTILFLTCVAVVSGFLIKGVHEPLASLNLWIYSHVPGFFLFREPGTKFRSQLVLACSMLLVYVLDAVPVSMVIPAARAGLLALSAGLVAALGMPALAGMVTAGLPDGRGAQTTTFPSYWIELASYLDQKAPDDGVALLPNDDTYLAGYTWGFYGADLVAFILFRQPVFLLYDSPQGYISAAQRVENLNERLVAELHAGNTSHLPYVLGAEGARYIILRRDIIADLPQRNIIAPWVLDRALRRTPELSFVRSFGPLDLYEIQASLVRPRIYAVRSAQAEVSPGPDLESISAADARGSVIVSAAAPSCTDSHPSEAVPRVEYASESPGEYTVRISGVQGPVVLVLNQTFNADWVATVVGHGPVADGCSESSLHHVAAYGFANAWWLPYLGSATVRLTFRPQGLANVGGMISVAGGLCISICWLIVIVSGRREEAAARSEPEFDDERATPAVRDLGIDDPYAPAR